MPALDVESESLPFEGGRAATLVRVRGSVDTSTLPRLDEALSEAAAGHEPLVAVDLSGLEYINSRGMANLVKHHDAVTQTGGRLILAGLPRKILAMFETMGIDSTFAMEADVDSALAGLATGAALPSGNPASFPLSLSCDACVAPLVADGPGRYRCPRCHGPFEIAADGKLLFFPAREARSVEVAFPCRATYVEAARAAAGSVAKDVELSAIPTELLDRAVDEAMGLFVGKAGEPCPAIRMLVGADNREFAIAFVVTDESLLITDADRQDLTFRTLNGIVDELEVVPLEPEGQILKLVKRLG